MSQFGHLLLIYGQTAQILTCQRTWTGLNNGNLPPFAKVSHVEMISAMHYSVMLQSTGTDPGLSECIFGKSEHAVGQEGSMEAATEIENQHGCEPVF
ncbi:hypothetical protein [Salinimonas chungwhensis]|uniref:hypothetical protein n=1 Tax=Salinimonas chungwhensis TaxID=265425 RepID=UPI000374E008|nr:hypothetical protein [Salinimonas chungwhensis]